MRRGIGRFCGLMAPGSSGHVIREGIGFDGKGTSNWYWPIMFGNGLGI